MTPDLKPISPGGYVHQHDPGEFRNGERDQPRISVSDEEAKILARLALHRRVLEIGTGLGVSTRALAETAKSVVTIDTDPWVQTNIWPKVRSSKVICMSGPLPPAWPKVELVFIDGDHAKESVLEDMSMALKALSQVGMIVLHDAKFPGVKEAMAELKIEPLLIGETTYKLALVIP